MTKVYLSLGSNIGNGKENISKAYALLGEMKIHIINYSSFYETTPVGYEDQDLFVNSVIEIETKLDPYALLDKCHAAEKALKRKRLIRWGPRTIDIDILLFNDLSLKDPNLIIPHKEIKNRGFVLVPLMELDNALEILGENIQKLVSEVDTSGVRLINDGR